MKKKCTPSKPFIHNQKEVELITFRAAYDLQHNKITYIIICEHYSLHIYINKPSPDGRVQRPGDVGGSEHQDALVVVSDA